jgi:hypothetical protein
MPPCKNGAEAATEISNIILSSDTMSHRLSGVWSNSQTSNFDGKKNIISWENSPFRSTNLIGHSQPIVSSPLDGDMSNFFFLRKELPEQETDSGIFLVTDEHLRENELKWTCLHRRASLMTGKVKNFYKESFWSECRNKIWLLPYSLRSHWCQDLAWCPIECVGWSHKECQLNQITTSVLNTVFSCFAQKYDVCHVEMHERCFF